MIGFLFVVLEVWFVEGLLIELIDYVVWSGCGVFVIVGGGCLLLFVEIDGVFGEFC